MNEAMACINCKGFNISLDLETGKHFCHNCNKDATIKKINLEDYKTKNVEQEEDNINKLKAIGMQISINTKTPSINDQNDFSQIGI